jgi:hypothetical protein
MDTGRNSQLGAPSGRGKGKYTLAPLPQHISSLQKLPQYESRLEPYQDAPPKKEIAHQRASSKDFIEQNKNYVRNLEQKKRLQMGVSGQAKLNISKSQAKLTSRRSSVIQSQATESAHASFYENALVPVQVV